VDSVRTFVAQVVAGIIHHPELHHHRYRSIRPSVSTTGVRDYWKLGSRSRPSPRQLMNVPG
jgi:hypothetical protein